ncbi:MAG: hypothetical protein HQ526_09685 [Actinobacteria bacterium]|nr:hypothetical protein [Actinomycetota bacterium]
MSSITKRFVPVVAVSLTLTGMAVAPSSAIEPCVISVPDRIVLKTNKTTTIPARVTSCPAEFSAASVKYAAWAYTRDGSSVSEFGFVYASGPLNPNTLLTNVANPTEVGTYKLRPGQLGNYLDGTTLVTIPVSGTPTIRAKLRSKVKLTVKKSGKQRTLQIKAKRDGKTEVAPATGKVKIFRNGKKIKKTQAEERQSEVDDKAIRQVVRVHSCDQYELGTNLQDRQKVGPLGLTRST